MPSFRRVATTVCAIALTALAARADDPKTIRALPATESIEIDGRLDESAWRDAVPVNDLVQQDPNPGTPIAYRTEVRVAYDRKRLYVSFDCWDDEPSLVVANEMRRDGAIWQNDNVYMVIDTFGDKRRGFFFRTNALGAQEDAAVTNDGENVNGSWDAIWESVGRRHERGWTVEMAIPFNQLRFRSQPEMAWGINFGRNISHLNSAAQWAPIPQSESWPGTYRPSFQGRLTGLQDVPTPAYLDIVPYVVAGISESQPESSWERSTVFDAGLDVKYGLTPSLTLDLTANTDFAQVEADREEVNLTRFDLYLPEKRDFFLEGAGLFEFAAGGGFDAPAMSLFYSRRIGIEGDQKVPILGGGKLTGKAGPYNIGLLSLVTDRSTAAPGTGFNVVRIQRDIMDRSSVGIIATHLQPGTGSDHSQNVGIDLMYRPQARLRLKALAAGSRSPGGDQTSGAWYASTEWSNDHFRLDGSYVDIPEDFSATMGFVQRTDVRTGRLRGGVDARPNRHGIGHLGLSAGGAYLQDHAGTTIGWDGFVSGSIDRRAGGGVFGGVSQNLDRVQEQFDVEGITIQARDYRMTRFDIELWTPESRSLAAFSRASYGDFYHGTRLGVSTGPQWRATTRLAIEGSYDGNRLSFPGGDRVTTHVVGSRVVYSFTTRLFTKLFAQWNDSAERVRANLLFHYIYRPGSDLYIVYDHGWAAKDRLRTDGWALVTKATYRFGF